MRIAITAAAPTLDAAVDPRFGRCPCFLIVEADSLSFDVIDNTNQELGQGAGIQSARLIVERGVKCLLTGNCGPNAQQTLAAAGVEVITNCTGTVRQVIDEFKTGQHRPAVTPTGPSHTNTSSSAGPAPAAGTHGPGGRNPNNAPA